MALFGDKNSPKTASTSSSTTKNTNIEPQVSSGGGAVTVGPTLSDVTNTGKIDISTTDQGAVAAGLQLGLKALDNANTSTTSALTASNQAEQAAIDVAQTAAVGQQNTSLKYILIAVVAVAAIAGAAYYLKKR